MRREGAETVIEFGDDGRGLDLARIRERAVQDGMMDEDAALTDEQITQLVFEPGLSTASEVTQTAGRGVGMDVAANEVRQLGGSIHIESARGQGARLHHTSAIYAGDQPGAAGAHRPKKPTRCR